jgi:acylphosphatase
LIARRCLVSGRVQGVFFRASTKQRAQALGVLGHACNLPDGRVEVVACGPRAAVDALCAWLWEGSPASSVAAVEVTELDPAAVAPWPTAFATK